VRMEGRNLKIFTYIYISNGQKMCLIRRLQFETAAN
jgi:hypothetical protein